MKADTRFRLVLALAALVGLAGAAIVVRRAPPPALLIPEGGALWIRYDRPIGLGIWKRRDTTTHFRTRFTVDAVPPDAALTLRAFRMAAVRLDGMPIFSTGREPTRWTTAHQIPLGPRLTPGRHTLEVSVFNRDAPPLLLAYSAALDLHTGSGWQAVEDGPTWTPALAADEVRPTALSRRFPRSDQALRSHLPLLLATFFAVAALAVTRRLPLGAGALRWLLIGAFAALTVNNVFKVPASVGFDAEAHIAYVRFVAERWRIPFATDGWEMFQAPLYYVLSAPLYGLLVACASSAAAIATLHLLPLLCGIAQVELSYRALRYAFPERDDLQCLGTLLGGLLPMNLYMSQYVSNEPLAAALSAAAIVIVMRLLREPPAARAPEWQWALGLVLGLAALTKVTAVLLVAPVLLALAYALRDHDPWPRTLARAWARVLVAVVAVAGWYYLRNWVVLGAPAFGGWEPERGITWWQDPGYRTLRSFTSFGEAMTYPVFSGVLGFWDSVFSTFWLDGFLGSMVTYEGRPPWNPSFMVAAPWLALLPAAAIVLGGLAALARGTRAAGGMLLFALACAGTYLATMLYGYLTLPIFAVAKATYTLGLTPCYAVLAAAGFDLLTRHPLARAAVYGSMACFALFAYVAYFAL